MVKAKFFQQKENQIIECRVCNHHCTIKNGDIGVCGTRKNKNGQLYSLVYGYPALINIEPVEKQPLFHFMPGTQTYAIGTNGCNLRCRNCQNWNISQSKNVEAKIQGLNYYEPARIIEEAMGSECESISFAYNEPSLYIEYALDIMKIAHDYGLKNIWNSNAYLTSEAIQSVLPLLDAINVDLKSVNDEFCRNHCQGSVVPILENLKLLKSEQAHLEISTPIITDANDDIDELCRIAEFIALELDTDTPWHLCRFNPDNSWKMKKHTPTGEDILYEAYEIGKEAGLKYVYISNVPGDQKENTYCPACGEMAVRRYSGQIERYDNTGRCAFCDKSLDIHES